MLKVIWAPWTERKEKQARRKAATRGMQRREEISSSQTQLSSSMKGKGKRQDKEVSGSDFFVELVSRADWEAVLQEIEQVGIFGFDLETTGLDPLSSSVRLCQLSLPGGGVYLADTRRLELPLDDLVELIERPDVKVVGHNLKFDLSFIQAPLKRRLRARNLFDTMLVSQVCWGGYFDLRRAERASKNPLKKVNPEHTLQALAERHLGIFLPKELQASDWSAEDLTEAQKLYAARDAAVLLPLHDILQELLKKNELEDIAEMEFRAIPAVIEMELQGLPLDASRAMALQEQKSASMLQLSQELQEEVQKAGYQPKPRRGRRQEMPSELNPDSTKEVLDFLRSQGYKGDTTSEEALKGLAQGGCKFADILLRYRTLKKQVEFLDGWLSRLSPIDGRLHPRYFQLSTRAGRFSSRDPNAQQIPKRGDGGREMRSLFKAPPGRKLIKADFAGIELRIMARISKDETMMRAFQEGLDLHRLTASKLAGVPIEEVTKEQRQSAKSANFGLIYGVSAEGFQRNTKNEYGIEMTLEEATRIRDTFFETYSKIAQFHETQRARKGCPGNFYTHNFREGFKALPAVYTATLRGRKRFWGWSEGKTLARNTELYNSPCQGTGADMLKEVLAALYEELPEEARLIGAIHDEILLEAPEGLAPEAAAILKAVMEREGSRMLSPVPVVAEVSILDSWGGDGS